MTTSTTKETHVPMDDPFPEFIRELPAPDRPLAAIRAHLLRGEGALAMFYDAPKDAVEVAEHSHGAQWGVVQDDIARSVRT